jgi:guanylate kinase
MTERPGVPILLTAPSGTGKTTLCRKVLSVLRDVTLSVSFTTRPPRRTEQDGVDYHFVDRAVFEERVAQGRFLEWATVHGNCYGTGTEYRDDWIAKGRDVLFDVDVQGAARLSAAFPGAAKVFLLPPSFAVLEARLRNRGQDAPDVIERRLANARRELEACRSFHHVIVNDDLDVAAETFIGLIRAERVRTVRMARVITTLLDEVAATRPPIQER